MAFQYTEEQLNKLDKELLVQLFLGLQEQVGALTLQTQELNDKMQRMMEQIVLSNRKQFGRSSEKMEDTAQICFMEVDGNIVFFNEAEAVCDLEATEPDDLELKPARKKKQPGKKAAALSNLKVNRIDHYLSQEELEAEFGVDGWKQLPDAITRRYRFIPVKVEVDEQNIILACMPQIRRTYGKGGSSKEPAPWKSGICVTDGYQVYHTLEKEREDLTIAGCWAHARRRSTGKKGN